MSHGDHGRGGLSGAGAGRPGAVIGPLPRTPGWHSAEHWINATASPDLGPTAFDLVSRRRGGVAIPETGRSVYPGRVRCNATRKTSVLRSPPVRGGSILAHPPAGQRPEVPAVALRSRRRHRPAEAHVTSFATEWGSAYNGRVTYLYPGFGRITSDPAILGGKPCVRGMRLSVQRILELLSTNPDWNELQAGFPQLEHDDIKEVLAFAAASLNDRVVPISSPAA